MVSVTPSLPTRGKACPATRWRPPHCADSLATRNVSELQKRIWDRKSIATGGALEATFDAPIRAAIVHGFGNGGTNSTALMVAISPYHDHLPRTPDQCDKGSTHGSEL